MAEEQTDGHFPDSQNSLTSLWNELCAYGEVGMYENQQAGQQHMRYDVSDPNPLQDWSSPGAAGTEHHVTSPQQCFGTDTATQAPLNLPHTPCHGGIKQEHLQANLSPDSGYNQPYSNESINNNNHDAHVTAMNEIPHVPEIREMVSRTPSKSNYSGPYGFEMSFEKTDYAVKNANYTHSHEVDKLYAKMNVACPVQFRCRNDPPPGSRIRAMMVYMRDEQSHDPVTRCPTHMMNATSRPELAKHLIQTVAPENGYDESDYNTSMYNMNSVCVPFSKPPVGEQHFTILYKFMCLSSCVGGVNRRPVVAVFTLEDQDCAVIGRRCIEVKICSSPGRDRKQDENRKRKKEIPPGSVPVALPKKPKMVVVGTPKNEGDGKDEVFLLRVKGRAKYELLKKIYDGLTLLEMATEGQRQQLQEQDDNIVQNFLKSLDQQIT